MADVQFEDHHDEDAPVECELQGEDLENKPYQMVRVTGLPPDFARKNRLQSNVNTIFADGAEIDDDTGELVLPVNANVQVRGKLSRG